MKTSLKWLGNYVDIPWGAGELAERLTMVGLEVEGIEEIGNLPDGVVVAEILSREAHPNADLLSVCSVSDGGAIPLQIVCGAPNCDPGKKVPLATAGTELGEGFVIKKAKLRGVLSEGMLCAEDELGLSDTHEGLLELPAETVAGTPLNRLFPHDTVIDWEITSNRPDWLSHLGIAREIAAVRGDRSALHLPVAELAEATDTSVNALATVAVLDPDLCPRYTARVIRGITINPSPEWLQQALKAVGLRPINNIVDITNYVLLECGQPLHAFDYNQLAGHKIIVRRATDGEKMVTLDGSESELTRESLLICDAERGVALAGVMGGLNSEINDDTDTVLLESAYFNPANIRATSRRLGISTESSYRFERGVDIDMVEFASRRAAALMCELAGGQVVSGCIDVYPVAHQPGEVTARFARINALVGVDISPDLVRGFLESLDLRVARLDAESITVRVPAFRLDLTREVDIIEEVARLYGLDNIPGAVAIAKTGGMRSADTYYPGAEARSQLRALGLDETMTYSFVNPETAIFCTGVSAAQLLKPSNPISHELAAMRPSLVPSLLQTLAHNIAHNCPDLAFFELGRVLVNMPGTPEERDQIGVMMSGRVHAERFGAEKNVPVDFYELKGLLESWFRARRLTPVCERAEHPAFRPGACAALLLAGEQVAVFGEVCAALTQNIRLRFPAFMALIEFDLVLRVASPPMLYEPLPQFPATARDISLVADSSLSHQDVMDAIAAMHVPIIECIQLFDLYEDEQTLGKNKKSLAYSITYRDPKKTLTDEQVNTIHERVRKHLVAKLPVELR